MIEHASGCAVNAVARGLCDCGAIDALADRLVAEHLADPQAPDGEVRRVTPDHVRAVIGETEWSNGSAVRFVRGKPETIAGYER